MFDSLLKWFVDGTSVQGNLSRLQILIVEIGPAGARLASEGDLEVAFAGKPGCYGG
jgi:hypothetical protein